MQLKLLLSIVLYIRDHRGLGLSGQNKTTKNQLHNTILVPWQYWLGITKPKSAFNTTLNAPTRLLQLKKLFNEIVCLPACLIPSGKCNLITAKAMGLSFSLFDVTLY